MAEYVFFYGTLMTPFNRPGRQKVSSKMTFAGRGRIRAALFDLGIYPAAVPSNDGSVVWGEIYELHDPATVLAALDEIEGYRASEPEQSLYVRELVDVTVSDGEASTIPQSPNGRVQSAWAYFYNAPLGGAQRIASGDYLEHLKVRD